MFTLKPKHFPIRDKNQTTQDTEESPKILNVKF